MGSEDWKKAAEIARASGSYGDGAKQQIAIMELRRFMESSDGHDVLYLLTTTNMQIIICHNGLAVMWLDGSGFRRCHTITAAAFTTSMPVISIDETVRAFADAGQNPLDLVQLIKSRIQTIADEVIKNKRGATPN